MTIKKNIFFTILYSTLFSLFLSPTLYPSNGPQGMPNVQVSQQQMEKMESLMSEMQNFYEALSPQEKDQFEAELASEVEKEQKKLSTMDPTQQEAYIKRAFEDIEKIEEFDMEPPLDNKALAEEAALPMPELEEDDVIIKARNIAEEEDQKTKIKKMLSTINEVVKVIEKIKEKLGAIKPSAQDLIDKWIKKDTYKSGLEKAQIGKPLEMKSKICSKN